jgi:hypothetical protein
LHSYTGQLVEERREVSRLYRQILLDLLGGYRFDPQWLIAYQTRCARSGNYDLVERDVVVFSSPTGSRRCDERPESRDDTGLE